MKTGKTPDLADIMWNCKMFDIPKACWHDAELIRAEYVDGLRFVGAKDMEQVLQVGNIKITKKGRDFLKDESVLSKIKPVLGTGFEALANCCGIYNYAVKIFSKLLKMCSILRSKTSIHSQKASQTRCSC